MALNFPASPSTGDVHNASNGLQYHFDGVKWISQGAYNTSTINTLNFTQQGTGAVSRSVQNKLEEFVSVKDFGAVGDGVTDDRIAIQTAINSGAKTIFFPEGTYYISNPGVSINSSDMRLEGTNATFLKAERTFFTSSGSGTSQYAVGQGNVINADTKDNITIKDITIIGAYESSFGNQNPYGNNIANDKGFHLLFIKNSTNITLDGFHIKKSFSSNVLKQGSYQQDSLLPNGYNQIQISGCTDIKLLNCSWTESAGEAWSLFNCDTVLVDGCIYDNNYGVSFLDITYSKHVTVTNSKFLRRLQSDSGNLLNLASSHVLVSNNQFLNGACDIGNEYLNTTASGEIGLSFLLENTVVDNNTFVNGEVLFSHGDTTHTVLSIVQENAVISNNSFTIDLSNRPAANGTTVLNYAAVILPKRYNNRNISISDNSIILKGALQTGGTPSNLNNIRIIDGVQDSDTSNTKVANDTSGFTLSNLNILGNVVKQNLTNYNSTYINNVSGFFVTEFGIYKEITIANNIVDLPVGITFRRHQELKDIVITNNQFKSENFLLMPWSAPPAFTITNFTVKQNTFDFYNTSGYSYTNSDYSRGFGFFILAEVGATSNVQNFNIQSNTVKSPSFVLLSNFQTSASVKTNAQIINNYVNLCNYNAEAGSAPLKRLIRLGRANSSNVRSSLILVDNYFINDTSADAIVEFFEWKILDLLRNQFLSGDNDQGFNFAFTTDGISGDNDPDSRFIAVDNIATGSITKSISGGTNTATIRHQQRNTTALGIDAAISNTLATDTGS